LAISMGDPSGIGPEVVLKALSSPKKKYRFQPLIIGSRRVFERTRSSLKLPLLLAPIKKPEDIAAPHQGIPVLETETFPERLPRFGAIDPAWSAAAMKCVEKGAELARSGEMDALVTAPINKEGIHKAGYSFQGHTDFLAHLTGASDYAMMMVGGKIRVVLASVHIPLRRVSASLTAAGILNKIKLAHAALVELGIASPRIAVAGLNPHAGEGGAFGREEIEVIKPAVDLAKKEGIAVSGPLPPDALFHKLFRGDYDLAVTMYHDQGLIPLKMVAFDRGVNVTLGLPLIRTSPDHGTAYDIAGKGLADPGSMIEAVEMACRLAFSRK